MKTTFLLALITLSITLGAADVHARPYDECVEYAAEANTSWASSLILGWCVEDDSFFFKSRQFSCAIKAGKAKTQQMAMLVFGRCNRD